MSTKRFLWYEYSIYLVIWLVVYLIPLMEFYWASEQGFAAEGYDEVFRSWIIYTPFLILFFVNDLLLYPWFFKRKNKMGQYTVASVFTVFVFLYGWSLVEKEVPFIHDRVMSHKMKMRMRKGLESHERNFEAHPEGFAPEPADAPSVNERKGDFPGNSFGHPRFAPHAPFMNLPWMLALSRFAFALLVVSFNVCIKLAFQSLQREKDLQKLEQEKLRAELDYLKYQINPHFYMNTLNNIHALIEIDPTRAQEAVLQLSKLMRYVLYEASQNMISLPEEIKFLHNYILLMRLRYSDKVEITESFPDTTSSGVKVPSMLFANFIENAFKHGVSYQQKSYINTSIHVDDANVVLKVENSIIASSSKADIRNSGIGLTNSRKRLNLIYGDKYLLDIHSTDKTYQMTLKIPKQC